MNDQIITKSSVKFGNIRMTNNSSATLYCASDVAKALGYKNPNKAINDHCRAITKRSTPISGKMQDVNFIGEGDVYRLICNSKLPSAREFEKWVFDDVVPKAVREKTKQPAPPEQLKLETSEYHYFNKTWRGVPVITAADYEHFAGVCSSTVISFLKTHCVRGVDYIYLEGCELAEFKCENLNVPRTVRSLYVITKSGFIKVSNYYGTGSDVPKCFIEEKKTPRHVIYPHDDMKSLMGYIQNEAKAIEGISWLLLSPDTEENLDNYCRLLSYRIRRLHGYCIDVETIIVK